MLTTYSASDPHSSSALVEPSYSTTSPESSSSNGEIPLFDENNPFGSMAEFANSHSYLSTHQIKEFSSRLVDFFTQRAYYDQECLIPKEQQKRFVKVHLPVLL